MTVTERRAWGTASRGVAAALCIILLGGIAAIQEGWTALIVGVIVTAVLISAVPRAGGRFLGPAAHDELWRRGRVAPGAVWRLAVAVPALSVAGLELLHLFGDEWSGPELPTADGPVLESLVVLVVAGIVGPVAEELAFRYALLGGLAALLPWWAAIGVSSALFGAMHGAQLWPLHVVTGVLHGVNARRAGVGTAIAGHVLGNSILLTVDLLLPIGSLSIAPWGVWAVVAPAAAVLMLTVPAPPWAGPER